MHKAYTRDSQTRLLDPKPYIDLAHQKMVGPFGICASKVERSHPPDIQMLDS